MSDQEKNNSEEAGSGIDYGKSGGSGKDNLFTDNSTSEDLNVEDADLEDDELSGLDDTDDTDKYLAMEQPGVQYTEETEPTVNSDNLDYGDTNPQNVWQPEGGNSKNSDAFNQDDYILEDNVDFDEDQNQSISSDDEDFEETNERYTN